MKQLLKNSVLLLLVAVFFSHCSNKEKEQTNDAKSFISQKVDNQLMIEICQTYDDSSVTFEGDFKVIKNTDNQVAIYTETKDKRHIFILDNVDKNLDIPNSIHKIAYLRNGILLNDDLFIGVEGNVDDRMLKNVERLSKKGTIKDSKEIKILLYKWYSKEKFNFKDFSILELINRKVTITESSRECISGGKGANSCSVSYRNYACFASCGAGFYACCDTQIIGEPDCQCKKIKEK